MPEQVYCYHCRSHHASEQVRLVQTKSGKRWRCNKSLAASRTSTTARDAFGAAVRQTNQSTAAHLSTATTPHCVLEVLRYAPERREVIA